MAPIGPGSLTGQLRVDTANPYDSSRKARDTCRSVLASMSTGRPRASGTSRATPASHCRTPSSSSGVAVACGRTATSVLGLAVHGSEGREYVS